jgi:hypothetical protein
MEHGGAKEGRLIEVTPLFGKEYLWRYFACGIVAHVRGFPYAIF